MLGRPFFDYVRGHLFGGSFRQEQFDGMLRIDRAWKCYGDRDIRKLAYVFATVYLETAHTMQPIAERGSNEYLRAKKYWPFIGRGYVQLTWERNYADWSKRLGVDLVRNPDLAMDPEFAGQILVQGMMLGTFTGKKLDDFINDDLCNFAEARRIINGTDKANVIAGFAGHFLMALQADAIQIERDKAAEARAKIPPPPDIEPIDPPVRKRGLFALIVDLVLAIFGVRK